MYERKDIEAILDAFDKFESGDESAFDGMSIVLDGDAGEIKKGSSKKFAGYTQADTKEGLLNAVMDNLESAGFFNE